MKLSAARLRAARRAKGMTQAELARAAGVTGQSISNHEVGKPATLETLHAYARALGCRPEDLAEDAPGGGKAPRGAVQMYPAAVVELLRVRRDLDVTPEEMAELTRYVSDGSPADVASLELELLTQRAKGLSDDALREFLAAVNRRRVAEGMQPWKPGAPEPTRAPQRAAKKKRA